MASMNKASTFLSFLEKLGFVSNGRSQNRSFPSGIFQKRASFLPVAVSSSTAQHDISVTVKLDMKATSQQVTTARSLRFHIFNFRKQACLKSIFIANNTGIATPPVPVMNINVPEVLTRNSYKRWSILMQHYLEAQDLWEIVVQLPEEGSPNTKEWIKKNALALYAIKTSCGTEAFQRIQDARSAKDCWDLLAHMYNPVNIVKPLAGPKNHEGAEEHKTLLDIINKGKFGNLEEFLEQYPGAKSSALNVAIFTGQPRLARKLINKMIDQKGVETKDKNGNTALANAVHYGSMDVAKCLIEKNETLLTIPDAKGRIPVQLACSIGDEGMTRYLYRETPLELLTPGRGNNAFNLLKECITKKMFDVAFDLLYHFPELAFHRCCLDRHTLLTTLAQFSESPFFSGIQNRLSFCRLCIYHCIRVKTKLIKPKRNLEADLLSGESSDGKKNGFFVYIILSVLILCDLGATLIKVLLWKLPVVLICGLCSMGSMLLKFLGLKQTDNLGLNSSYADEVLHELGLSMLRKFHGFKKIYDIRLNHAYADEVLRLMCEQLKNLDQNKLVDSGAVEATFQAIENGIPEIAIEFTNANNNILWSSFDPEDSRNIFLWTIAHRQEEVARFLYGCVASTSSEVITIVDAEGNNVLHGTAKLAPDSQLRRHSGPALQFQNELRWFKAVEGIVPRFFKEHKNKDGKTPYQMFVREHEDLLKQAEGWMKKMADSSTVVGALIITIMFAAAFTVPGGNNQDTGHPIFSNEPSFTIFIVSDAISLFAASTSVLTFLGVHTARFVADDLVIASLIKKLSIGFSMLLVSIATMMVSFCAALFLMLQRQWWIIVPIMVSAMVPVAVFTYIQFPILAEIFSLRSQIFNRQKRACCSNSSKIYSS